MVSGELGTYPALDNEALVEMLFPLDDRWLESSHNSLCGRQRNKEKKKTAKQGNTYLIENVLETLLSECRALDVLDRTKLTRETFSLFRGDGPLLLSLELLHYLRIIA